LGGVATGESTDIPSIALVVGLPVGFSFLFASSRRDHRLVPLPLSKSESAWWLAGRRDCQRDYFDSWMWDDLGDIEACAKRETLGP